MKHTVLALSFLIPACFVQAQSVVSCVDMSPGRDVTGMVLDGAQAGLANVAVQLFKKGATTACASLKTKREGNFRMTSVGPGKYELRVKASGFAERKIHLSIDLTPDGQAVDIGQVVLRISCDEPGVFCHDIGK